jgi:hypothetical protein
MIDIAHIKCIKCNIKRPNFNYINQHKALYCNGCKLPDMVDIKSAKCIKCNIIQASYNYPNKTKKLYCNKCKLPDMVDIHNKNKKCTNCKLTIAVFNYSDQTNGLYCNNCKLPDMVNIKSKKCIICNLKHSNFNYINEKIALYCNSCKLPDMVDIKHNKCKLCKLYRSDKKHKYYCTSCFHYTFPDNKLSRNHKSKENQIINDLNYKLNNIIIQDKKIYDGCSRRRPDGLIKLSDYNIIIEIDENQHYNYECENKRSMELFQDLGNSPLTLIRFNPDGYISKENKKIKSLFGNTNIDGKLKIINQIEYNKRFNILLEVIKYNIKNLPVKEFNYIELYYNNYD